MIDAGAAAAGDGNAEVAAGASEGGSEASDGAGAASDGAGATWRIRPRTSNSSRFTAVASTLVEMESAFPTTAVSVGRRNSRPWVSPGTTLSLRRIPGSNASIQASVQAKGRVLPATGPVALKV